jgi:hypothetical protein
MAKGTRNQTRSGFTRRGFLGGIGTGAIGAAGTVAIPEHVNAQQSPDRFGDPRGDIRNETRPDRFSRMFGQLPSFADNGLRVQSALRELGKKGGLLDANDDLAAGPLNLILTPGPNLDNPTTTAGVTFFGQFLDHDMTFDAESRLGVATRPERSPNSRTPSLDLDSVYGRGPFADRHLYDPGDPVKFKIEKTSEAGFEDLPRASSGAAIIPDPRNDEHVIIGGMQAAFLCFHNKVVDMLRADGNDERLSHRDDEEAEDAATTVNAEAFDDFRESSRLRNVFSEARRIVTWHYQWIIVNEFLPNIVGASLVNDVLTRGRRFYRPQAGEASIPVEFQMAYRFGHSVVRPSYRANMRGDNGNPFFAFIFDPEGRGPDPIDLRGGFRAPRRFVGWQTFFNFGGALAADVRPNKMIDTKISTPLFTLPLGAIASGDPPISLPQRNLLRHLTWSLPSGQDIARMMGIRPLASSQLSELAEFRVGFERSTPLWYYILKEAELAGGATLAGVGARIVTEVFLGLLAMDRNSYLSQRRWRPTLPSGTPGTFRMIDLLTFAGVDPASRGQ